MTQQVTPEEIKAVFSRATCLYSADAVEAAVQRMATAITAKLAESNPVLLCTMIGGVVPSGLLLTRLHFPLQVDYVHATRYHGETVGKELEWRTKPYISLKDRTVLVVDDILDGGVTLQGIIDYCKEQGAKEVFSAVLVEKDAPREKGGMQKADFTGVKVENRYVFGYGMDYKRYLRNTRGIFAVAPEDEK